VTLFDGVFDCCGVTELVGLRELEGVKEGVEVNDGVTELVGVGDNGVSYRITTKPLVPVALQPPYPCCKI
jgi:hypothetical protein